MCPSAIPLRVEVKNNEATQKYWVQGIYSALIAYICSTVVEVHKLKCRDDVGALL